MAEKKFKVFKGLDVINITKEELGEIRHQAELEKKQLCCYRGNFKEDGYWYRPLCINIGVKQSPRISDDYYCEVHYNKLFEDHNNKPYLTEGIVSRRDALGYDPR